MHNFERTGVIDAEVTGGVGECEFLVRACFEAAVRFDYSRTHFMREVSRVGHCRINLAIYAFSKEALV